MGSETRQLHVFFIPFMAKGHTIPLTDIARLFSSRGIKSSIISTPLNAPHLVESLAPDIQSGLDIGVLVIPFPSVEAGLPEGCETADKITSADMFPRFFKALGMLQPSFEKLLEKHRPDCVVSSLFLPWTTDSANKYGIPRIVFTGGSNFSMSVLENIKRYAPQTNVGSDSEVFIVPGLPDEIEITKAQLPQRGEILKSDNPFFATMVRMEETEIKSLGVLVNSFYELEPSYVEYYIKDMGRRAWNIGPVSLCNRSSSTKADRGMKATISEHHCLNWLKSKKPNTVLYVSFGSISRFSVAQLHEIAMGLEASQVSFIWVVRAPGNKAKEELLPQGFEERMEGKGLVIRDWAPQVLILDHPSVGGFLTHCGWNSTLEGICAGVPFITWPVFAEQFLNEKHITQVMKTGISAGNEVWSEWIEPKDVSVTKEKVEEVVNQLMGDTEEAYDIRMRAKELGVMAKRAVEEGGSSYNDLSSVINALRENSEKLLQAHTTTSQ
ncbi:hypothetical protein ACHQM5_000381 [Ranunculus cassubicifolius]